MTAMKIRTVKERAEYLKRCPPMQTDWTEYAEGMTREQYRAIFDAITARSSSAKELSALGREIVKRYPDSTARQDIMASLRIKVGIARAGIV